MAVISLRRARITERHQHADQHGDGRHRESDLEQVERVVVHDDAGRDAVLLEVVEQVHEVGQEEDRGERQQHERHVREPGAGDVAVEQRSETQVQARDPDHHHGTGGRAGRGPAGGGARAPHAGDEAQVVRRIEGVERRLAVVEVEQRDRGRAEHDVGAPHRQPRPQLAGVARLLAEPDQHVVDEDHADRQREGGRARLLPAAERQRQPEQPEHQAGRRDRELLVPLDREAAPLRARLALRAQVGHALLQLRQRHLAVALREQQLLAVRERTRRPAGPSPSSRSRCGCRRAARRRRSCAGCRPRARCARSAARGRRRGRRSWRGSAWFRRCRGCRRSAGSSSCRPARRPGRRASSGPAAPSR